MRCEDYPCCGHTDDDPCGVQWYDRPGAFDTTIPGNEHALCDHENGECDVPDDEDENEDYAYEQGYLSGSGEHESDSYLNYLNG
jgi:hypothetical protein